MSLETYNKVNVAIKDRLLNSSDWSKELLKMQDSFIAWVVGFSVSGITLLISYNNKLPCSIKSVAKGIIILLCVSIVFGFIWRLRSFSLIPKFRDAENDLLTYLTETGIPPFEISQEIMNTNEFDAVYKEINDDHPNFFEGRTLEQVKHEKTIDELKVYYKSLVDRTKLDVDAAINGYTKKAMGIFKIKKMKQSQIGFNAKIVARTMGLFYYLSVCSFLLAIIILTIGFLNIF